MRLKSSFSVVFLLFCLFFTFGYCQISGWGWNLPFPYRCQERPVQALCRILPNPNIRPPSDIHGIAMFTQRISCLGYYTLQVQITVSGMTPNGNWTYHGLHVHDTGDMSDGCDSMGAHFNPYRTPHGSPRDPQRRRHVGDFGNVVKDPFGNIQGAMFENHASLIGPLSIVRRGLVLHEFQDDLGRGNNEESLRTGNAGRRLACCVIEPI